jgi:hypothetical protein
VVTLDVHYACAIHVSELFSVLFIQGIEMVARPFLERGLDWKAKYTFNTDFWVFLRDGL